MPVPSNAKKKKPEFNSYEEFMRWQEKLNGQENHGENFSVRPTIQEKFEEEVQQEADLLSLIHTQDVIKEQGGKIVFDISGPVTTRTDTSGGSQRSATDFADTSDDGYVCQKFHFDAKMPWDKKDEMEQFKDRYYKIYQKALRKRAGLDRQYVCLNGTSIVASTTTLAELDKGWIQKTREQNPGNVISEIVGASGEVTIGAAQDYENLDQLVAETKMGIPEEKRYDLVTLVGETIISTEEGKLYGDKGDTPSEKILIRKALESYGGLPTYIPTFMPAATIMITRFKNLAFYWLRKSWERQFKNSHEDEAWLDFNRYKGTAVVQDYDSIMVVENIVYS